MEITRVSQKHAEEAANILSAAFEKDPLASWIFGEGEQYRRLAPKFYKYMTDYTLSVGEAYMDADGRAAILHQPSESVIRTAAEEEQVQEELRKVGEDAADRLLAFMNSAREHHPNMVTAHTYWTWGGVLPKYHGQGIGDVLFKHALQSQSDRPFYGESTSARNFAFHSRLGSKELFKFRVSNGGPSLTAIWREPTP